jgi:Uma2 family endonuclease
MLLVEATDSSFRRDQQIKLPVYGAAGIREFWIADLDREEIIVHREPQRSSYKSVEIRQGDDRVSPMAAPELSFAVRQAFE